MKTRWRRVWANDHSSLTCSVSAAAGSRPARLPPRPEPLDGVPYRADVVGVTARAELHPLRVAAVQLGADEFGDVDAVDRDVAEVAGDADVDQPAVPDRDAGQVAVGEPGPAQVRDVEPGPAEPRAAAALTGVEPVRPELRLPALISGNRCRAGRVVDLCHGPHDSAARRQRAVCACSLVNPTATRRPRPCGPGLALAARPAAVSAGQV